MRESVAIVCLLGVVAFSESTASAQDQGRVGLSMGYPGDVSVLWHLGDRVALRPGISFSHNSSETKIGSDLRLGLPGFTTISTTSKSSGWTVGAGITALLYVKKWDNVRAYVAPSYAYRRSTVTNTFSLGSVLPAGFESLYGVLIGGLGISTPLARIESRKVTSGAHQIGGTFGVEYTPHRRFGTFGEVGVRHGRNAGGNLDTETRTVGNTTGAGVIFYF